MGKPLWLDKFKMSSWAKQYCLYVKDNQDFRKFITVPMDICLYCKNDDYSLVERCVRESKYCEWLHDSSFEGLKFVIKFDEF